MVTGSCELTSAEVISAVSGTHRVAPGFAGSGTGRNGLGSTIEATAEAAGDWSDRRCGLNPIPMSSIATTTVFLVGFSSEVFGESVLSIGGGGLAVHPASTATDSAASIWMARLAARRRAPGITLGTLQRGPVPCLPPRQLAGPLVGVEHDLAHPHHVGADLDALVGGAELERALQVEHQRPRQGLQHVAGGAAHVGQLLLAGDIDVEVLRARVDADDHALVGVRARLDEEGAAVGQLQHGVGGDAARAVGH